MWLGTPLHWLEREGLKHRTGGEHVVEVPVLHFGEEDGKLLEVREDARTVGEVGRVRKGPVTKAEAAELVAAEDVRGKAQVQISRYADEDEVLDAPVGEEVLPLGELSLFLLEAAGEIEGLERARVSDVVDGGDALASVEAGMWSSQRTSGTRCQMRRQREESMVVSTASSMGRRER